MKSIWKFPLSGLTELQISMPKGADVLTAQNQDGQIVLWAIVDLEREPETRSFCIYGTGLSLPDDGRRRTYVATVQVGALVWHVFQIQPKP